MAGHIQLPPLPPPPPFAYRLPPPFAYRLPPPFAYRLPPPFTYRLPPPLIPPAACVCAPRRYAHYHVPLPLPPPSPTARFSAPRRRSSYRLHVCTPPLQALPRPLVAPPPPLDSAPLPAHGAAARLQVGDEWRPATCTRTHCRLRPHRPSSPATPASPPLHAPPPAAAACQCCYCTHSLSRAHTTYYRPLRRALTSLVRAPHSYTTPTLPLAARLAPTIRSCAPSSTSAPRWFAYQRQA
ncbi:hypothetical protein DENSPDRAFT_880860 [Dentipellis sp. KUC8613]|nr:hypothetical protein DENSPDRAFT_880860 [Dentipellis sp. KUC8613]